MSKSIESLLVGNALYFQNLTENGTKLADVIKRANAARARALTPAEFHVIDSNLKAAMEGKDLYDAKHNISRIRRWFFGSYSSAETLRGELQAEAARTPEIPRDFVRKDYLSFPRVETTLTPRRSLSAEERQKIKSKFLSLQDMQLFKDYGARLDAQPDGSYTLVFLHMVDQEYGNVIEHLKDKYDLDLSRFTRNTKRLGEIDISETSTSKRVDFIPNTSSESDVFASALAQFKGLVIGESHGDPAVRQSIYDHLAQMQKQAVKTLFIENLHYELQPALDAYFLSPLGTPLPDSLAWALEHIERASTEKQKTAHPGEYQSSRIPTREIIRRAKSLGIRVVAVNTVSASSVVTNEWFFTKRIQVMNDHAEKIIEHEKGLGKFVVWVGSGHATNYWEGQREDPVVAGLGERLACPTIAICQAKQSSIQVDTRVNKANKRIVYLEPNDPFHVLIEKAPPARMPVARTPVPKQVPVGLAYY